MKHIHTYIHTYILHTRSKCFCGTWGFHTTHPCWKGRRFTRCLCSHRSRFVCACALVMSEFHLRVHGICLSFLCVYLAYVWVCLCAWDMSGCMSIHSIAQVALCLEHVSSTNFANTLWSLHGCSFAFSYVWKLFVKTHNSQAGVAMLLARILFAWLYLGSSGSYADVCKVPSDHVFVFVYIFMHKSLRTCINTMSYVHVVDRHAYIYTCMHTYMWCMHTYMHACIHVTMYMLSTAAAGKAYCVNNVNTDMLCMWCMSPCHKAYFIQTCVQVCSHICLSHVYKCMHMYIRNSDMHTCTCIYACTSMLTPLHINIHAYIHTHTSTYIHVFIHIHTNT